jgi:DNA-binding transcriptional LysR family regulator
LIKRSTAAFYELKQSVLEIEFLADPTQGELRVGCSDAVSASILPPIMYSFSQLYPRVVLYVSDTTPAPRREIAALRDGEHDLFLLRLASPLDHDFVDDDLDVEFLFDDGLVLATGEQNPWARRRKIDLAELIDEPWIIPAPGTWSYTAIMEAFKARSLGMPKIALMATSVPLRAHFLRLGPYIATFARGNLLPIADQYGFKVLSVDVSILPASMVIVTLKGRTLSPVAERFIEHVRKFTQPMRSHSK